MDYLFIRRTAETQIARANLKLDPNPPRKPDASGIPGPARGREGLIQDLSEAMIPYTPEELIALAEKEFAWCDQEMLKASREMGFGNDWKKAIEKTKDTAVPPGGQPRMIMDLLVEAVDYLRANRLITVPQVAAESLHMIMMSPERQLVNPFFTGGGQISVSYPTNTMDYDARIQSMRGNNPGFSHATAHHEMIPGHNLVGYLGARFADYRANLSGGGPFFGEGWPLYWELTLYDLGFNKTPEQRVGALFWRMHRCARIIFSLKFHMGQWSPQEAIDFLVDRVGHERENATAEVRRSFDPAAGYGPLYQAAYLLGGLQLRGLRKELVDSRLHDQRAVPRRDHAPGRHADFAAAARRQQPAQADARHGRRLEVLRGSVQVGSGRLSRAAAPEISQPRAPRVRLARSFLSPLLTVRFRYRKRYLAGHPAAV